MRASTALATAVVVLAADACGSSGHPASSNPGSPAPVLVTTTPSAANDTKPASAATLKRLVIQASDLPTGWTGTAHTGRDDDYAHVVISGCLGVTAPSKADQSVTQVHGADLHSDVLSVESLAQSFRTDEAVQADSAIFSNPKLGGCLEALLKKELPAELPGARVSSSRTTAVPGSGVVVVTLTTVMTTVVQGHAATVHQDSVILAGHQVEADLTFLALNSTFPPEVESYVTTRLAQRVAEA